MCRSPDRDLRSVVTGHPPDPAEPDAMCVHGNPKVLTDDAGTSSPARGCSGPHALVEVEKFTGELPPVRTYQPPAVVAR